MVQRESFQFWGVQFFFCYGDQSSPEDQARHRDEIPLFHPPFIPDLLYAHSHTDLGTSYSCNSTRQPASLTPANCKTCKEWKGKRSIWHLGNSIPVSSSSLSPPHPPTHLLTSPNSLSLRRTRPGLYNLSIYPDDPFCQTSRRIMKARGVLGWEGEVESRRTRRKKKGSRYPDSVPSPPASFSLPRSVVIMPAQWLHKNKRITNGPLTTNERMDKRKWTNNG